MWNTLSIEKKMEELLKEQFGPEKGSEFYNQYTGARNSLIADNFFQQIPSVEPSLSDHGERHIANVLQNTERLLGEDINKLSGIELYCLGLVVLFHDVGNIEGRQSHNKNIADVYNFVRKKEQRFNHERMVIIKAAEAHCGKSRDGSRDTLKDVDIISNLEGEKIRLRDIAAILRLADELAEGKQRTSQFMQERHKYDSSSTIYHTYASITQMFIDRANGRISVTYNIDLDDKSTKENLKELLEFTYHRIIKMDEERRYTKYYCDLLVPFKKLSIQFNFTVDGLPINLDLGRIEIPDRFPIPGEGDDERGMEELIRENSSLDIEKIWSEIEPNFVKNQD